MRILAFDTATAATAVAIADLPLGSGVVLEARDDPPAGERPGHTQRLLALIAELLERSGGFSAVDRIAVGVGPGTFTGLRIGIASAHALARARNLDLVGVCSLRALALAAHGSAPPPGRGVLALIDARRGELFGAGWPSGADPRTETPLVGPSVLEPAALDGTLTVLGQRPELLGAGDPGLLVVGDGAVKFRSVLQRSGAMVPDDRVALHRVSALSHCVLAADMTPGPPAAVLPEYLRLADAEIARRKAAQT